MKKPEVGADPVIGGKTLAEWDQEWRPVEGGFAVPHPELYGKAGLFAAIQGGVIVAIGKASERKGGRLSKRLSDFIRQSDSARRHRMGEFIHANADSLELQVLISGDDVKACQLAAQLRGPMIKRHRPRENSPARVVQQAVARGYRRKRQVGDG